MEFITHLQMPGNREIFFRHMGLPSMRPLGVEVERAAGIFIYDTDGKEYIDLVSGVTVSNIGHRHPKVIQAIQEQLNKYLHLMVYGEFIQEPQVKLAQLIIDHLPPKLNSVYFVNSGSEANEGALKLAKRYTRRNEIISFKNAYHGGTHGALSVLGNEILKNAFRPLLPGIRQIRFNGFNDLDQITEQTACVVAETIQAEAGIILPEKGYLQALRKRCDETGALLIIDDVQMGFGRTGKLFSYEHFGIIPDILTLAKGMGGGMPLGAFIAPRKMMTTLTYEPELGHITTFGGHPVSCSAAIANLSVLLDDDLCSQAELKASYYIEALSNHHEIEAIRHKGLMISISLKDENNAEKLLALFLKNGLISDRFLFRPDSLRIAPPLNISKKEIDISIGRILNSLNEL